MLRNPITMLTSACLRFLSLSKCLQFTPSKPISFRSSLTLSSRLCPYLPNGSYLHVFLRNIHTKQKKKLYEQSCSFGPSCCRSQVRRLKCSGLGDSKHFSNSTCSSFSRTCRPWVWFCYYRLKMSDLCYIFQGYIIHFRTMILSCILVTRHT
jgi:hypothetical protein